MTSDEEHKELSELLDSLIEELEASGHDDFDEWIRSGPNSLPEDFEARDRDDLTNPPEH